MGILHLHREDPHYPDSLLRCLGTRAPDTLSAIGNVELLKEELLAVFCSIKCPGSVILQTYDVAQALRESGRSVISGFHSPIERECLTILLRGVNPIVVCLARGIERMRIPKAYQKALEDDQLLLLSSFSDKICRADTTITTTRNLVVAALAHEVFVAHAEPGSRTSMLCDDVLKWGKSLLTVDNSSNSKLFALGAKPIRTLKGDD
jgi:predicted Rossmann fold nucleotide-binding protein DprA/Smf involved in DNA uptake